MWPVEYIHPATWDWFWLVTAFLFGAVVGSFLNVVIARVPLRQSVVYPPSQCPGCSTPIHWYDNVPLLSYVLLLGRCRSCGDRISLRYPLVELMTAAVSALLMGRFGPSSAYGALFVFCALLIAIFWIDLDLLIIPDVLSLPGIVIGIAASSLGAIPEMTWQASLLGCVLGGLILWLPAVLYEKIRGIEGLGGGDIKLLAMVGAFLGPYGVVFTLFLSSFTGAVGALLGMLINRTEANTPIPFGPFIAAAAVVYLFFGPNFVDYFFTLNQPFIIPGE